MRHLRRRTQIFTITAMVATALLAPASPAVLAASVRPATTSCSLPVAHDANDGFRIGVPSGWDLSTLGGTVVATKNNLEQSIVYPAVMTKGLKSSTFFSSYMSHLKKSVNSGGNSFTYTMTNKSGQLPAATLTAHIGGHVLNGRATTEVIPDRTAHGSSLIALRAYWAPKSQLAGQQAQLAAVGNCFAPAQANLYHIFHVQGDPYTFAMPPGWKDAGENQDQILFRTATTRPRSSTGWG